MAVLAKEKQELYTVDHIFALPDGERAELIDGVLYDMAPPARGHQRLLLELATVINNYIESHGGETARSMLLPSLYSWMTAI